MTSSLLLLTGASGFLGRAFIPELAAHGFSVIGLSRNPQAATKEVSWVRGDLTDRDVVARALDGVSVVVNNAGDTSKKDDDRDALMRINRDAAAFLARAARDAGVTRFVQVSSTGVFGPGDRVFDETSVCRPQNAYERSKLEGELAVLAEASTRMGVTVVRPSNVFGEGDPKKKLLTWLRRLRRGQAALANDPTRSWVNYVYVGDVARATAEVAVRALKDGAATERYIINTPMTMRAFFDASADALETKRAALLLPAPLLMLAATAFDFMARLRGRSFSLTKDKVKELVNRQIFSDENLRGSLPEFPYYGVAVGLRRLVDSYRKEGLL